MTIFLFNSYKEFIKEHLQNLPKAGHGEFRKFAEAMKVNSTFVTQVFKGDLHLSIEQGYRLTNYLALNELETDYFMLLLQYERSGDSQTQKYFFGKMTELKKENLNIKKRLKAESVLSESDHARFFSHWKYTLIFLMPSLTDFQTKDSIAKAVQLPKKEVFEIIDFLIETGLFKDKNGQLTIGDSHIFIGKDSPFIKNHHVNWRMHSIQNLSNHSIEDDVYFTNVNFISKADSDRLKEMILTFIEQYRMISQPSKSEELFCLNLDFYKVL